MEKTVKKKNVKDSKSGVKRKKEKKSKFALFWESQREPGFEIVDMRAVLR
ncbi:hypothetical protein FACS189446_5570 [Bacteroidia bacterium]|nr:hypothetical protein FACS189446_5570 [Bacteroidia bacterium]